MFDVVIVANGKSLRMGFDKLSADLGSSTVLQRTVNAFKDIDEISDIILVCDAAVDIDGVIKVKGGSSRQESVFHGLQASSAQYVLIHDGARPFVTKNLIKKIIDDTLKFGSSVPCIKSCDSIRETENGRITGGIDRDKYLLVQTPQGFELNALRSAFDRAKITDKSYTDESEIYSEFVSPCHVTEGERRNKKITTPTDLFGINAKIGTGFDVHRFTENKILKLCGIPVPYKYGLLAHSDGDVALHALMDALLTAIGERDIGVHFPDTDDRYKNADSASLLKTVMALVTKSNAEIVSVNLTIIAQKPKLSPHIENMRRNISTLLNVAIDTVSISATTTENLGLIGDGKAIAAMATVIIN